jgi:uncharacterized protein YecE (DUF72 family)
MRAVTSDKLEPDELARVAAALPPLVRFGASSWNYPDWRGLVYHRDYPARGAVAKMLEEYARFPLFRTVAIDSSFYDPPSDATLADYARYLPEGFPCVSKVWNGITVHTFTRHNDRKRAGQPNPDFLDPDAFLESMWQPYQASFAGHAGPFVFEFGTMSRATGPSPEAFAERLDRFFEKLPREGQYGVEVRNEEFLTPMYFAVLREHGVAHVFNYWSRMPGIGEQLDHEGAITAPFVVARAIVRPGRSYEDAVVEMQPYDRLHDPDPGLRRDLLRLLQTALALRLPAYIIVNNRAEGSAPRTILDLARALVDVSPRATGA